MRGRTTVVLLAQLALVAACGGGDPAPVGSPEDSAPGRIAVPEGDGRAVLTDGIFTPGEWDDALRLTVDNALTLHLKQVRDHLFVGASVSGLNVPIVDLFLQVGDGPVMQFHASAQLGERSLAPQGQEDPEFQWGRTVDWYANEVRYDRPLRDSLEAAGADPRHAIRASLYPYDGFEMQFRRTKFPGSEWRMRVEVAGGPDYQVPHIYPAGTERKDVTGWAVLSLSGSPGS